MASRARKSLYLWAPECWSFLSFQKSSTGGYSTRHQIKFPQSIYLMGNFGDLCIDSEPRSQHSPERNKGWVFEPALPGLESCARKYCILLWRWIFSGGEADMVALIQLWYCIWVSTGRTRNRRRKARKSQSMDPDTISLSSSGTQCARLSAHPLFHLEYFFVRRTLGG